MNAPTALVRYEVAYRFETRFRLVVQQKGREKLDRLYGARENVKIWPFGKRLTNEVALVLGRVGKYRVGGARCSR